jgi:hypothetical protein
MRPTAQPDLSRSRLGIAAEAVSAFVVFLARVLFPERRTIR